MFSSITIGAFSISFLVLVSSFYIAYYKQSPFLSSSPLSTKTYEAPIQNSNLPIQERVPDELLVTLFPGYTLEQHSDAIGEDIWPYIWTAYSINSDHILYIGKDIGHELLRSIRRDQGVNFVEYNFPGSYKSRGMGWKRITPQAPLLNSDIPAERRVSGSYTVYLLAGSTLKEHFAAIDKDILPHIITTYEFLYADRIVYAGMSIGEELLDAIRKDPMVDFVSCNSRNVPLE